MNIALLNKRITIQKNAVWTDAVGNHKSVWLDYFSCAATVSNETNSETEDSGTTVDNTNTDFTIRYSSETSVLTPTGYRVVMDSQLYDILSVDHMNFKRRCIKLRCRKERR